MLSEPTNLLTIEVNHFCVNFIYPAHFYCNQNSTLSYKSLGDFSKVLLACCTIAHPMPRKTLLMITVCLYNTNRWLSTGFACDLIFYTSQIHTGNNSFCPASWLLLSLHCVVQLAPISTHCRSYTQCLCTNKKLPFTLHVKAMLIVRSYVGLYTYSDFLFPVSRSP